MATFPTLDEIRATREMLTGRVRQTPCVELQPGELHSDLEFDSTLVFKLELLQLTGTFKVRGVLSVMLSLNSNERARGVTAVSAGNHAIAVAFAARALGVSAHVVMIRTASAVRVELAKAYGAQVEMAEDGPTAFRRVKEIEAQEGRVFVHPFEGPYTLRGTGTLGLELLEQVPALDAVVVAVGGGGLIGGIAAAIKQVAPQTRVYGVEPVGANSMTKSFAAGQVVSLPSVSTIADSLAPPMATPYTFGVCKRFVDQLVVIEDQALCASMGILFRDLKLAVEPAGAAALAAALGPLRPQIQGGQRIGIVVCGSNIDMEMFYRYVGPPS